MVNKLYKVGTVRQIDIKYKTNYFYNGMIDIKKFDSVLDILQLKKLMIMKIFIV